MNRHHDRCFHTTLFHSLIALVFLNGALFTGLFTSTHALAQIRSDPSAPRNQRPTVLLAPNGVPLVNIQTPSAAGVSRNTYSQFDVQPNGAILNNSRTDTATQLGGWVQANPWLATGSARVILNEVNSNNPSNLNGWVEVAGSRAQVVVANPAGISCNGCGFINASKTTLATGTPTIASTTQSSANAIGASRFTRTGIDRVAGLYVTGKDGSTAYSNGDSATTNPTLIATAGNNLNVSGAQIINSSSGATQLQAGQDIVLSAITTAQDDNAVWNAKNHSRLATSQDVGTAITTQSDISLQAGRDITARAANVTLHQFAASKMLFRKIRSTILRLSYFPIPTTHKSIVIFNRTFLNIRDKK